MSNGEGIVVYSTKGNVMFSSTGELIPNNNKLRKHNIRKNIQFPEFVQMKDGEEEEFWTNTFTRFSKNIFPKDFKYIGNVLYYKPGTKKHRDECFIDKESNQESKEKLKKFLRDKGIISSKEKEEINKIVEDNLNLQKNEITWKEIFKSRDFYLKDFSDRMEDKLSLTNGEKNHLDSLIRIGISADFFNDTNVIISDGRIDDITNLIWSGDNREFKIETKDCKLKRKNEKKTGDKIFQTYSIETATDNVITVTKEIEDLCVEKKWCKFLETVFKDD